jgi:hypothetical protein
MSAHQFGKGFLGILQGIGPRQFLVGLRIHATVCYPEAGKPDTTE